MPPKREKPIFRNLVFALCGDFSSTENENLPYSKIETWITAHAGTCVEEVTKNTTHLICTMEEFLRKNRGTKVAKALKIQGCKIVSYEWLQECLSLHAVKRKVKEKPFLLKEMAKREKVVQKLRKEARERMENDGLLANELVNTTRTGSFHIYVDQTGFKYEVPMTYITFLDDNNTVRTKKYTLYLFETNALPHLYKWGAKFNDGKKKAAFYREGCATQMHFDQAFAGFRDFFRKKTGVNWDERCDGVVVKDVDKFRYSPPEDGKPVGMLPPTYLRPKKAVDDEDANGSEDGDEETEDSGEERTESEASDTDQSTMTRKGVDEEPPRKRRRLSPSPSPLDHGYHFASSILTSPSGLCFDPLLWQAILYHNTEVAADQVGNSQNRKFAEYFATSVPIHVQHFSLEK